MKNTYLFIMSLIALSIISCENQTKKSKYNIEETNNSRKTTFESDSSKNQLKRSNDLGEKWLTDFYTEYIKFDLNSPNGKDKSKLHLFFKELDSIKKKNCTQDFYEIQKEDFSKDFDYITNNEFICEQSLSSLKINKKEKVENTYVVSFIAEYPLNATKSEYKRASFDVEIVNENSVYKISKTCCF